MMFLSIFLTPAVYAAGRIEDGSAVQLKYFLEVNGSPVVLPEKKEAMAFVVGGGMYPPAFEKQLIGLKVGDNKNIRLAPEQGFGPIREDLVKRVPKNQLPPSIPLKEGTLLGGKGQRTMRIAKVLEDSIILDENHPFAGKTLDYHVQVTDVK